MAKVQRHQGELFPRVGFIVTNLGGDAPKIVNFSTGVAPPSSRSRKANAPFDGHPVCSRFDANQVRLQLHVLAYNLGNFPRRIALQASVKHWTLTTLWGKLIKIARKRVRHARYATFQLAEVAVPMRLY